MERFQTKRPKGPFARAVSRWRRRAAAVALPVMLSSIPLGASVNGTQLSEYLPDAGTITVANDAAQTIPTKAHTERLQVASIDPTTFIEEHPVLKITPVIEPETTLRGVEMPTQNINARINDAFVATGETKPEPITSLLMDVPFTIEQVEQQFTVASLPPLDEVQVYMPEPLTSPHAVNRWKINDVVRDKLAYGLQLSAKAMDALDLSPDSIVAWHKGRPMVLQDILRDTLIFQVPHPDFYPEWVECLEREGFNRRKHNYAATSDLGRRLANTESAGYACAVSYAKNYGAMGHFQFMHPTARAYNMDDPFHVTEAIPSLNAYLADLDRQTDGNEVDMVSRFSSGKDASAGHRITETFNHCVRTLGKAACAIKRNFRSAGKPRNQQAEVAEKPKRKRFFLFGRRDGEPRRHVRMSNDMR